MRVASLLPSATEIVCMLGLDQLLVGRSHECDAPASILGLPVLTTTSIESDRPSAEIDAQVKNHLAHGLSLYGVRMELLAELQPDLILTQAHCEVCAVSERDLEGLDARVLSLSPTTLAEVWASIKAVGAALGHPERGERIAWQLEAMIGAVERVIADRPKPTVGCIEWTDPLMSAGNWVPELVEKAGGVPVLGNTGEHSPWLSWQELLEADPEVLVLMPCGFDLERTRREADVLRQEPQWASLRAVRNQRVYAVDGNQYFNRPGPRLVDSVEILAEILHGLDLGHRLSWSAI